MRFWIKRKSHITRFDNVDPLHAPAVSTNIIFSPLHLTSLTMFPLPQNIRPLDLLPHLIRANLLKDSDIDFIYDPKYQEREKIKRILRTAPCRDSGAFERFVDSFEADRSHAAHMYLARKLRETIEKKRLYPFSKLMVIHNERRPLY